MVSSVPRPLTSIAPPSITTRTASAVAARLREPTAAAPATAPSCEGRRLSRWWLSYLAQRVELPVDERRRARACWLGGSSPTTNVGPESRSQTRSVAALKNRTASRLTPAASSRSATRRFIGAAADDDVHLLDAAQVADDLGVDPGNRSELAGPVVAVVRPGDPGRRVRLPFGGHAIAQRTGRLIRGRRSRVAARIVLAHGSCSVEEPLGDRCVGVDAAIAQERPVAAGFLLEPGVAAGDHDLLGVVDRPGR